jgi:hypothetical protein
MAYVKRLAVPVCVLGACLALGAPRAFAADTTPPPDDSAALFAAGLRALGDDRPNEAIADFEALGDRGVVDPVVSFDRGLAYAARVRGRTPDPGDLGRAAHGFEEARALTHDKALARDATRALGLVRAEVARRRAMKGDPVEVDPGVSLGRAIVGLASEEAWAAMTAAAALVLTVALFVRWLASGHRVRITAAIALAGSVPVLFGGAILVLASRDERLNLREGVVVSERATLSDERHIAPIGAPPLPEGARVTIEEAASGWARVRFGSQRGFVSSAMVRPLARAD